MQNELSLTINTATSSQSDIVSPSPIITSAIFLLCLIIIFAFVLVFKFIGKTLKEKINKE